MDPLSTEDEVFTVDFTNETKGKSKYVFDNGAYPAVVTDVQAGTAASGNAKYVFTWLFTGGPGEGTTKEQHLSLSDKALWKLGNTLKALGVVASDGSKTVKFKRSEVVGKKAILNMKQNPQPSGKVFMDIEAVLPFDASGIAAPIATTTKGTNNSLPF